MAKLSDSQKENIINLLDDLTKEELSVKKEEVKIRKKYNKTLEKNIKNNEELVTEYKKSIKNKKTEDKEKLKYNSLLKEEIEELQKRKKYDKTIKKQEDDLRDISIKQLKQSIKERKRYLEAGSIEKSIIKLTDIQKKYYSGLIEKQKKETERQKAERQLQDQKFIQKGRLGLLGSYIGGNIKSTISDIIDNIPFLNLFGGFRKYYKESKEKQFDIISNMIGDQKNISNKGNITQQSNMLQGNIFSKTVRDPKGRFAKRQKDRFDDLIEINKNGFDSIVKTLISIDKGEDIEDIQLQRDNERRKRTELQPRDKLGKFTKKESDNSSFFGSLFGNILGNSLKGFSGGILGSILSVLGPIGLGAGIILLGGELAKNLGLIEKSPIDYIVDFTKYFKSLNDKTAEIFKINPNKNFFDIIADDILGKKLNITPSENIYNEQLKKINPPSKEDKDYLDTLKDLQKFKTIKNPKKKASGGFLGMGGSELYWTGDKPSGGAPEFLLDNKSTQTFFKSLTKAENILSLNNNNKIQEDMLMQLKLSNKILENISSMNGTINNFISSNNNIDNAQQTIIPDVHYKFESMLG